MAIDSSKSPYDSWKESQSSRDYRDKSTQNSDYVKLALSQEKNLRHSYRVNPGPNANLRRNMAKNFEQNPHVYGAEDMWGWQQWADKASTTSSSLAPGLYESPYTDQANGTQYYGRSKVQGWAGCTSCKRKRV